MLFDIQHAYGLSDAQIGLLLGVAVAVAGASSAVMAHLCRPRRRAPPALGRALALVRSCCACWRCPARSGPSWWCWWWSRSPAEASTPP